MHFYKLCYNHETLHQQLPYEFNIEHCNSVTLLFYSSLKIFCSLNFRHVTPVMKIL